MGLLDWFTEKILRVKPRSPEWCEQELRRLIQERKGFESIISSEGGDLLKSHGVVEVTTGTTGFDKDIEDLTTRISQINKQIQGLKRYMESHNYPIPKDLNK